MAGIGVKLNRIFEKKSVLASLVGFVYSTVATVAPIFLVILVIQLMGFVLGLNKMGYQAKELLFCTILYTFIFALLTRRPLTRCCRSTCRTRSLRSDPRIFCPAIIWGLR